ncbi:MAG: hypothetical protein JSU68_08325, partial [Phycisphaerales bacterium]
MSRQTLSRRQFMGGALAVSVATAGRAETHTASSDGTRWRLFWGDLHNHNAVGYAKGSLRRSIEIAREHLDFFTGRFTSESYIVHQLVGPAECSARVRFHDRRPAVQGPDWYYVRVTQ